MFIFIAHNCNRKMDRSRIGQQNHTKTGQFLFYNFHQFIVLCVLFLLSPRRVFGRFLLFLVTDELHGPMVTSCFSDTTVPRAHGHPIHFALCVYYSTRDCIVLLFTSLILSPSLCRPLAHSRSLSLAAALSVVPVRSGRIDITASSVLLQMNK